MDPKDFPWTEDQQVTVTNPTREDYPFKVHNKEYVVGAGKSYKMPGYIAWRYVYEMASKLCQEHIPNEFMRWNEEGFRKEYYQKAYIGTEPVVQAVIEEQPLVTLIDDVEEEGDEEPEPEQRQPVTAGVAPMSAKAGTSGRTTKTSR